jgi:hypothetical protein
MTDNIIIGENAYVSVSLQPLADGMYRLEGFSKLRALDPEVDRLYHNQEECVVIDARLGLRVAPSFMTFMKPGKIVENSFISQLENAGAKLVEIEKQVAECAAKPPIKIYVGGAEPAPLDIKVNDWVYYKNPYYPEKSKAETCGPSRIAEINGDSIVINDVLEVVGHDVNSTINRSDVTEKFVPDEHHQQLLPHKFVGIATCRHADGSEYSWWYIPGEMEVCNADLLLVEHFDGTRSVARCDRTKLVPTIRVLLDENAPKCRVLENFHNRVRNIRNVDADV